MNSLALRSLGREREREENVMVTFNYACVYVCICDAPHFSVTVHSERFQESRKFGTECRVTVVLISTKHLMN